MSFGAVSPQLMLHAYAQGIFPMAENAEDHDLFWVDPKRRGILPLDGFHISRSLRRFLHGHKITATLNQAFDSVLQHCADREETWINPTLHATYTALNEMGCCHSLEVWDDGALLGGVFGIAIGGVFCGESMFSRRTNGSKAALAFLTTHLRNCGFALFDTQFITDHLQTLGALEISRAQYRSRLAEALALPATITAQPLPDVHNVLQRRTQTS
ncbi:leucyl/phenylalanyl-tRNA--protein transferase [Planktomarina temperata]|nr:leucyl/phenylalanyl-tRNA--protein transferase [Planktomarina temperata]